MSDSAEEGGGSRVLKVVGVAVVLLVLALVAMALLADQAEPLPFNYEGF